VSTRDFRTGVSRATPIAGRLEIGLGALVLVAAIAACASSWSQRAQARAELAGAQAEAEQSRTRLTRLRDRAATAVDPVVLAVSSPPGRIVADLAAILPPDVRLEQVGVRYAGGVLLELQVIARTPEAYDAFLDRLVGSPRFTSVLPGDEARSSELRASVRARYVVAP
jgi:hypothetical protein